MEKNKGIITVILVMFFMLAVIVIALVVVFKGKDLVKMLNIHTALPPPPKSVQLSKPSTSKTATSSASSKIEKPKPKPIPPPGFTAEQLSPYYELVSINSVSPPKNRDPLNPISQKDSFVLTARSFEQPIDITGWRLKTNSGWLTFPQGVSDYNPFGWKVSDIFLDSSSNVYVYSAQGMLGTNVRVNKCMGYFNSVYGVNIFSYSCPAILENRRDIVRFSGECQSLIMSLNACRGLTNTERNKLSSMNDGRECLSYIEERFGYTNCYKRHHLAQDFFSKTWYIWLNQKIPFDTQHDYVLLLDKNGLLVDEYIY